MHTRNFVVVLAALPAMFGSFAYVTSGEPDETIIEGDLGKRLDAAIEELDKERYSIKRMKDSKQWSVSLEELEQYLLSCLP